MSQQHKNLDIQEENEIQKILNQIQRNYYLFIIWIAIALVIAYFVNHYSIPVYKVNSSILIRDNKNQNQMPNVNGFLDLASMMGSNKTFNNELLVLKSTPIIEKTVVELDLFVDYYKKNKWRFFDAYHDVPFKVLYSPKHPQLLGMKFELSYINDSIITINGESKLCSTYSYDTRTGLDTYENLKIQKTGKIGELIQDDKFSFIIVADSLRNIPRNEKSYFFEFFAYDDVVQNYRDAVEYKIIDIDATAVELSIKSPSYQKGIDLLSTIAQVYLNETIRKRSHIASITIDYIDKQLGDISDSLTTTERKLQVYRSENQIVNITEQSTGIANQFRDLENRYADLVAQKKYYEYVDDYLAKNQNFTNIIAPATMGVQDPILTNLMTELVRCQSEKNSLIENKQEKNPLVKQLDIKIENIKSTITENINSILKTTDISIEEVSKRINVIKYEINKLPKTERELLGIERKFKLNNEIYTYLLEKRAEANIMKASNLPDNEVIEPAKPVSNIPVSPNKRLNYILAVFLGFILPFSYLRVRSILTSKIDKQEAITRITSFPILGKVLHNNKKVNDVVYQMPNSSIAESFRTLRTNLEFYVRGGQKRVILVTSSVAGEGKSFNALNIALSYAMYNRKTILLGFDLRKPSNFFNANEGSLVGLTSYLINKSNLDDIIIKTDNDYFDYIPAGPLPPNPIELIGLNKTENLLMQLKNHYDYIIIDTPPLGQVSDAYLLMKYADVKVLVVRYNYTLKSILSLVIKDLNQKQIESVAILMNDNRAYNEQYGYGYYSSESKKKWWQFWK